MTVTPDLFPGFQSKTVALTGHSVFARIGGSGPPLLLLHGYPQTHACWHKIAGRLAADFTVVAADLRGYGQSSVAADDPSGPAAYSKRRMAEDAVALMRALGHPRFLVSGHDRGGRVAYRLALDAPAAIIAVAVLDIVPTAFVWRGMDRAVALKSYHWPFLAQPAPLPETLIAGAGDFYADWTLASWTKSRDLGCFDPAALAQYRNNFADPARIHAMCEDYRAGAGIDRDLDEADLAAGRRIEAPLIALWGSDYVGRGSGGPIDLWKQLGTQVEGTAIDAGHFLAEENPEATLEALLPFLRRTASS